MDSVKEVSTSFRLVVGLSPTMDRITAALMEMGCVVGSCRDLRVMRVSALIVPAGVDPTPERSVLVGVVWSLRDLTIFSVMREIVEPVSIMPRTTQDRPPCSTRTLQTQRMAAGLGTGSANVISGCELDEEFDEVGEVLEPLEVVCLLSSTCSIE